MTTIWRQIPFQRLTDTQKQEKLKKDSEYEIAVQNLSTGFYQKKRAKGVSKKEQNDYNEAKTKLWNDYKEWAVSQGLYEEVTPEQQLTEAENGLTVQVERINVIRQELGRKSLKIIEE